MQKEKKAWTVLIIIIIIIFGIGIWSSNEVDKIRKKINLEKCGDENIKWNEYSCCKENRGCWFPDWRLKEIYLDYLNHYGTKNCTELRRLYDWTRYDHRKALLEIYEVKGCNKSIR